MDRYIARGRTAPVELVPGESRKAGFDDVTGQTEIVRAGPPRTMKHQGPSAYTVYATNGRDVDGRYLPDLYCGSYETLEEARGCVEFDGLTSWEIWLGDRIVDESVESRCAEMSVAGAEAVQ